MVRVPSVGTAIQVPTVWYPICATLQYRKFHAHGLLSYSHEYGLLPVFNADIHAVFIALT